MSETIASANLKVPSRHEVVRVRREPRRRELTVTAIEDITPRMRRVSLASPDLEGFESQGFDDHVKLFFPPSEGQPGRGPGGMVMRDYTPRAFDAASRTLVLDFVLHDAGPATAWARSARLGSTLTIGGPRGSALTPDDFDWHLFIGDETALPAIGRRLGELRAGAPVTTAILVEDLDERQPIGAATDWSPIWVERGRGPDDAAAVIAALAGFTPPPGDGYVWIGAEAKVARALRAWTTDAFAGLPVWVKASGYWVRGQPGETDRLD